MRVFKLLSLMLVVAFVLSACAQPAPAPAPAAPAAKAEPTTAPAAGGELKVAILAPLTGPVPTFGVSTRDGALLAIDEWNAKGGVLGRRIVPIVEDSQCTPDPALNAARKVIDQDKVKYIIGEVCSKASIAVAGEVNAKKVVQISPTSTNVSVTVDSDGKVRPYTFRACFLDPFQGKVGARDIALGIIKAKTAFIMLDQSNDYVKGLAEAFEKEFIAGGGKVVGKENYTDKDTDFSAILAKVAAAKPDMVYLPDYYNIVNLVTKQAKEKGITVPFAGGDGWDSADLDTKAADGGYFSNHYAPDDPNNKAVPALVKAYGAKYKGVVPDALAVLAYDATNMLLQSIKEAGVDDATKVAEALAKIKFDGVSGTITLDANHNPVKPATIIAVKDGKVTYHSLAKP